MVVITIWESDTEYLSHIKSTRTKYLYYYFLPDPDTHVQERQPSWPTGPNVYLLLHDDIHNS